MLRKSISSPLLAGSQKIALNPASEQGSTKVLTNEAMIVQVKKTVEANMAVGFVNSKE